MKHLVLLDAANWAYGLRPTTDEEVERLENSALALQAIGLRVAPVVTVEADAPTSESYPLGRIYDAATGSFGEPCPRPKSET